ncbi:MAG: ATP-binding protein [Bacteroidota bacterium]
MTSIWHHVRTVMKNYEIGSDTLVSLIDGDGKLYSMNAGMRKMLAIKPAAKNNNIFDFLDAADARKLRESVKRCIKTQTICSKINFQNGVSHLVSLNMHVLPSTGNTGQFFVCLGEEIKPGASTTVRHESAEVITAEKKAVTIDQQGLFESAMDNSPALSWMIDEDERLIYANKAYKKFFALPPQAIGEDIRKYIAPAVIQSLYEKHKGSFYANKPCTSIEKAFLADGSTIQFKVMLFPALNKMGGKVITGQAILLPTQQEVQAGEKMELRPELSETILQVLERERTRIGYELHDNINQILTTVHLFIGQLQVTGDEQQNLREKSKDYLLNAIEEIRNLSKGLVTPHLKEKGLIESIRTMINDFSITGTRDIHFTHDDRTGSLNPGRTLTLFRIVQEQLKNIVKYSAATLVTVNLENTNDIVTLTISDNGKGFNPKQTTRGIGLSNIYERTRIYGGSVIIETSPGDGCTLTVRIPAE